MFVAVGVILLVDVIYLVVVTAIPSTRLELVEVEQASEVSLSCVLLHLLSIMDTEHKYFKMLVRYYDQKLALCIFVHNFVSE